MKQGCCISSKGVKSYRIPENYGMVINVQVFNILGQIIISIKIVLLSNKDLVVNYTNLGFSFILALKLEC